ncbi:MAG: cysteinyl-tRNA synthetase [Chloroflexi bacterium]|nr:cysteinyl-tRNA synthetase [Chloroflexota bacterium]
MKPGLVVLLGSGETSSIGGQAFESVVRQLPAAPRIAVLETPAGFELNSAVVAGRVADFLSQRLQNYRPEISVIPARKRNTQFSPDSPELIRPLLKANLIFMGPGSPSYAVRQLQNSLAWHSLIARHRLGAAVVLASAAVAAISAYALPVYEIYKVGDELGWRPGLDFFGAYGLPLVCIPHWNNAEGGATLDTSRCFMGQERFAQLVALLPREMTIVGIDEHTALVVDLSSMQCQVLGHGGVTVIKDGREQKHAAQENFPLAVLGEARHASREPSSGLPAAVWEGALAAQAEPAPPAAPPEVITLMEQRQISRDQRDWARADHLREQIAAYGWIVVDTREGPHLEPAVGGRL